MSKRSVNYRMATSLARSCGVCAMYHAAMRRCDLVRGDISVQGTCDRWVMRAG